MVLHHGERPWRSPRHFEALVAAPPALLPHVPHFSFVQGLEKGLARGRLEGERASLTRQLRRRFGELPASVLAQVEQADLAALERWSDALFETRTLEELFPST